MSVAIKCERSYDKAALKAIIECCGCSPPPEPQCPPVCCTPRCMLVQCCPSSSPPCGPCPLPSNQPIPASCKPIRPIVITPYNVGGLFYTGISRP